MPRTCSAGPMDHRYPTRQSLHLVERSTFTASTGSRREVGAKAHLDNNRLPADSEYPHSVTESCPAHRCLLFCLQPAGEPYIGHQTARPGFRFPSMSSQKVAKSGCSGLMIEKGVPLRLLRDAEGGREQNGAIRHHPRTISRDDDDRPEDVCRRRR